VEQGVHNPTVDVCDLPRVPTWRGVNRSKSGDRVTEDSGYCTRESPCALGEGDCDENDDATCRGFLRCKPNAGNQFGFANNNVDVCVHPDYYRRQPRPVRGGDRYTPKLA
jgi:hypothetical protein